MSSNYPAGVTDAHPHFNYSECECPQLFQCQRCDELTIEPSEDRQCADSACRAEAAEEEGTVYPAIVKPIDREDNDFEALSGCSQHGWCTGCSRRSCEDCGGDYDPDN